MPRVTIPGVGDVMMPDSMSRDEIMARATAMQQRAMAPQQPAQSILDPRELGLGQLLKGGASRGLEGLKGTLLETLPALGASAIGQDEFARRKLGEYQQRMQAAEEENPTAYKSYKDVAGPTGSVLGYGAETLGELAPDIGAFLGGAELGELGGKYLAKKGATKYLETALPEYVAKKGLTEEAAAGLQDRVLSKAATKGAEVGSKIGLTGASLATNVPDVFQSIYQDTGELHPGIALTIGPLVAALDTYLPEKMLTQLGDAGKKRIAAAMLQKSEVVPPTWKKAFATEVLKTTGGEALTEGAQQALQNYASILAGNKEDFFSQKNIDNILNASLQGAIGGGVLGAPGAALHAARTKTLAQERADQIANQPPAPPAPPAAEPPAPPLTALQEYQARKFANAPAGTQGVLFPEEEQKLRVAQLNQRPAPSLPIAEETHPEVPAGQGELDLQGGYHFPVDQEAEAAKQKADEERLLNNQIYQEQLQAQQERAKQAKLRFDSAVAETDGRVESGEIKRREAARLDVLHPILENHAITNTAEAFQAALARNGYANTELTDTEKNLIQHADDMKAALAESDRIENEPLAPAPAAPNELTPDITGIKEKGPKGEAGTPAPKEPKQELIPGLGYPTKEERRTYVPPEPVLEEGEEPKPEPPGPPESTVLDPAMLDATGLSKQSGFYKQLVNKDLSNPEHQKQVADVLVRVRSNPTLAPSTKAAIEAVAMKAYRNLATQQPLFGPRGGVAKGAERANTEPSKPNVSGNVGVGTTTPSVSGSGAARGTKETGAVGVVPTEGATSESGAGEKTKSGALNEPKSTKKVNKPAPKTTTATEGKKPSTNKAAKDLEETGPAKAHPSFSETIKRGYTNFFKKDIENTDDHIAVSEAILSKMAKSPIARAAATYFKKMPRIVDGLLNMAFDHVYQPARFRAEGESREEARFFQGLNGNTASLAVKWVRENLSPETNAILDNEINKFSRAKTILNDEAFIESLSKVMTGKEPEIDETLDEYIKAYAEEQRTKKPITPDAVTSLGYDLHPMVMTALQDGDLKGALNLLSATSGGFVSKLGQAYSKILGNTKVQVVDNLLDDAGNPVPGLYDPKTDTIYLDSKTGMNPHVLLHESTHALTSHTLDNPSHPLTRQLQQLFDKVKGSLDTAYGATDLHEFVSEAKSNLQFRGLLQSINPDGQKHSAWDRFTRAIANFLRRLVGMEPKPLESALDQMDRLVDAILSPSPESRDAGALYAAKSPAKTKELFTGVDKVIRATPYLTDSQKAALSGAIDTGTGAVKSAIFSVLPLHAMAEMADKIFPELGTKFNTLINERAGYKGDINKKIDAVVSEAKHAIKTAPKQQEEFNKIVHESTIAGVDPTNPASKYKDAELTKWKELDARYKKLNPVWKNLYVTMRNAYKEMYEEIKRSLGERIDGTDLSDETKEKIKTEIMTRLANKGMIEPYFALGREGDKWLGFNYVDKDGQAQRAQEAFKTDYERKLRMEEIAKWGATEIEPYAQLSDVNFRRAPSGSFVNSVLGILEHNRPTNPSPEVAKRFDDAIDEMMRLFISTLPETAFAQSFQKRNNTPGYKEDSIGVFERKMRNTSNQIANMKYNPKLNAVVDTMRDQTTAKGKTGAGNDVEKEYVSEFEKRLKDATNPSRSNFGRIASSAVYTYTLGFNASSALVNLAQVPMIVAPYLKGQYGEAGVAKALGDASKLFLGAGTKARVNVLGSDRTTELKVMPSIANYSPDTAIGKQYATLIERMNATGQLNRSQLHEMISGDTRTGLLQKINAMSGWMFSQTERMNREVTTIAAYNLELAKLKKAGVPDVAAERQAADHAIYTTQLLNGSTAAAAAPRIAQGGIGKLMYMYKNYGVSQYYMLMKTAKLALQGESPEVKKAAWKQLGGIIGMTALMAGIQGIPMYGLASMVYAMFADPDDDDLDTVTRKYLGEFAFKGPIEYMTNLSIASRIGLTDLIVRDNKAGTAAGTFTDQVTQMLGGPAFSIGDRVVRGFSKINDGNLERGLEDILPAFAANPLKGLRYYFEGANTLRGDPITGEVSAWNSMAQAFGFAPADYSRQLEINSREKGIDKFINTKVTQLKRKYYTASRVGDSEEKADAREALLQIGAKHPELGINGGTINQILTASQAAQEKSTKKMIHGVMISDKRRKEVLEDEAEMND